MFGDKQNDHGEPMMVVAAKVRDAELQFASSSGGVFSLLARQIIRGGGCVFGAAWDANWNVVHKGVDDECGLAELRGSKYVQSNMTGVYDKVYDAIKANRKVLFSGVPCQVAAIKSFLCGRGVSAHDSNVLFVEIICHGGANPLVWEAYKRQLGCNQITDVQFKNKVKGWANPTMIISSRNGEIIHEPLYSNAYGRAYMSGLAIRQQCFSCAFKHGISGADITLGDFWGIEKWIPHINAGAGVSAVIVHSLLGKEAIAGLAEELDSYDAKLSWLIERNPNYSRPTKMPKQWKKFNRLYVNREMGSLVCNLLDGPFIVRLFKRVVAKTSQMVIGR